MPVLGTAPLPVVWDEDVADAFYLALDRDIAGAFNLVAADPLPPRDLGRGAGMRAISVPKMLVRGLTAVTGGGDPAWLDATQVRIVYAADKARRELGWTPRCPTSIDVMRKLVVDTPRRLDPRIAAFFALTGIVGRLRKTPDEARNVNARI